MNEPQDAEIVNAVALRPAQPLEAPQLWGTADQSAILAKATATANALKDVVKSRGLISTISGREYPRCEAWTLLGTLLGVFPVLQWTKAVDNGWEARVEARTLSGSVVGAAEAQCLYTEKNWSNRDDFALRSMAQTRATAKALRMPLGFVMTLAGYEATPAEEMTHEQPQRTSRHAPAATPAAAAQPKSQSSSAGASLPKGKSVEMLLEASRTAFLKELAKYPLPQVWAALVRHGGILPTERIEAVTASKLFQTASGFCGGEQSQGTYEAASKAIKGGHDEWVILIKATKPTSEEAIQFDAVYGAGPSTEAPDKPPVSTDAAGGNSEWFWGVICPIPYKGMKKAEYEKNPDTVGSLYDAAKSGDGIARNRLFGFANKWKPEARDYQGKTYPPSAADLKFREALDAFLEWEEVKGAEGAEQMRENADKDDNLPF